MSLGKKKQGPTRPTFVPNSNRGRPGDASLSPFLNKRNKTACRQLVKNAPSGEWIFSGLH